MCVLWLSTTTAAAVCHLRLLPLFVVAVVAVVVVVGADAGADANAPDPADDDNDHDADDNCDDDTAVDFIQPWCFQWASLSLTCSPHNRTPLICTIFAAISFVFIFLARSPALMVMCVPHLFIPPRFHTVFPGPSLHPKLLLLSLLPLRLVGH